MSRYPKIAAAVTVVTLSTVTLVQAAQNKEAEIARIGQAAIPLSQAAQVAATHVGGLVTRAEYEQTKAGMAFDVEVVKGEKVFDVRVDAKTGAILSSASDKPDRNREQENDHEGDQEQDPVD